MLNFKRSVYDQKNIFIINTSHRKKNHYTHAQGQNFCANFVSLAYKNRPYWGIYGNSEAQLSN